MNKELKTLSLIYELGKDKAFSQAQSKLMFEDYCFNYIRVDPRQESTYSLSSSEMAKSMLRKLDAADEIYIVNPKGTITGYANQFLSYAKENNKPVRYMYKFCYKDCKFYKKNKCDYANEKHFIPEFHQYLPACENYSRIYDDLVVTSKEASVTPALPQEENAPALEEAAVVAEVVEAVEEAAKTEEELV